MVIDEYPFPPITSINTSTANDLRAFPKTKREGRLPPKVWIRKVCVPKQYLTYMDDLRAKGKQPRK